jgi:hypothetical protein
MLRWGRCVLIAMVMPSVASAVAQEACPERVLDVRFSPPVGRANNWCWASSAQMVMELLGAEPDEACQCRQAEQVLGVTGCCVTPSSCVPAADLPARCDRPNWPPFVGHAERYPFDYLTTCDGLAGRQDDEACDGRPLAWRALTAEICAGRPVIASLHPRGSSRGHMIVVMGFSTYPAPRVLVVDPMRLCPPGRNCYGQLNEAFWLSYDEYVAGWGGMVHWVDFYGIRKR